MICLQKSREIVFDTSSRNRLFIISHSRSGHVPSFCEYLTRVRQEILTFIDERQMHDPRAMWRKRIPNRDCWKC